MSVENIKQELAALSEGEQQEVTAFLFHLRHADDMEYQSAIAKRMADREPSQWLTPEEFEKRLGEP